jgi:Cu+-exporting ATPase
MVGRFKVIGNGGFLMPSQPAQAAPDTLTLTIEGMSCASCVKRVETVAGRVPGVEDSSVNLASESLTLRTGEGFSAGALAVAVKKAGYSVAPRKLEIAVEGMTCASCVRRVENAILRVAGVLAASVNLATERASVDLLGGEPQQAAVLRAIETAGYAAHSADGAGSGESRDAGKAEEVRRLQRDVMIAAILTLPLFMLEMGSHLFPPLHHWLMASLSTTSLYLLYFALATAVMFGPGRRFLTKGFPALLRGAPDMNSLVALGTSAAYGYSVVVTFAPQLLPPVAHNIYYEAAAVIVALILVGRLLEARAKGRTSQAIKRLVGLQAKSARVVKNGAVVEVPLEAVAVGDVIVIRPGEKVPVDGEVTEGSSFVDEAMISGEPIPVAKAQGDAVIGGTINKTGSFRFCATKVGADTMLAQIIRLVEEAQGSKLPIQLLVDQVTAWFVPAVMAVAAATFTLWAIFGPEPAYTFAMVNAVAVLIVACPCAMGLATPTSIMVGTGRGAEIGVLFRKGDALQQLRAARVVALDKTGTLTKGRPELTDLLVAPECDEAEVLALVAAVEAQSEHPIAEAIVTAAGQRGLALASPSAFEAVPGYGVKAIVAGRRVEVGADRFMAKLGYDLAAFAADIDRLADEGKTPLFAAIDGKIAAAIAVADPVKPTSRQAVEQLHAMGIRIAMITGDNRRTAEAIGRTLGIDQVIAEVLPAGKVAALHRLRAGGDTLAFVGDGINDAPALAEADIGIAIGTGTDVAIESADVVLVGGDLLGAVNAIALSRATMRNIKQNLFWAFGYNVLLIPVAAGLLYPAFGLLLSPMLGAGAMALSSVFVLSNALRLRGFVPPQGEAAQETATGAPAPAAA